MANDAADGMGSQSNWKQKDPTTDNYTYIKSVDFIESKIGYDFF